MAERLDTSRNLQDPVRQTPPTPLSHREILLVLGRQMITPTYIVFLMKYWTSSCNGPGTPVGGGGQNPGIRFNVLMNSFRSLPLLRLHPSLGASPMYAVAGV